MIDNQGERGSEKVYLVDGIARAGLSRGEISNLQNTGHEVCDANGVKIERPKGKPEGIGKPRIGKGLSVQYVEDAGNYFTKEVKDVGIDKSQPKGDRD